MPRICAAFKRVIILCFFERTNILFGLGCVFTATVVPVTSVPSISHKILAFQKSACIFAVGEKMLCSIRCKDEVQVRESVLFKLLSLYLP
jgi:hypothetical protein